MRCLRPDSLVRPGRARVLWLFVLVNVPALVLVGWLVVNLPALHAIGIAALVACLVVGLIGNVLLYQSMAEVMSRMSRSMDDCSDELELARSAAEAASRAKNRFLANISHELRTPLNGILGMAEVLALSELTGEQARLIATLTRSAEKLQRLLEQLLDYARSQTGDLHLERRPFSLRELLRDTLLSWIDEARRKGVRLSQEVPTDLPDRYLADPHRLRQVLCELVENAVKFTQRGEVIVSAGAVGGMLTFEVRDTGVGIPEEKRRSIFAPFEQIDGSLTRRQGGVGLGLSLAARLVALMGGQIEVQSHEGQGSLFRVQIPVRTVEAEPVHSALLVVADRTERERLSGLLEEAGCLVVAVSDGQTGMTELIRRMVEGNPFTLVVLEERLPDISADDWLKQLNDSPARCPAILLCEGPAQHLANGHIVVRRTSGLDELRAALPRLPAGEPGT